MNTCYYYLIVEPLINEYKDDSNAKPASFAIIETESKEYQVSFFTTHNRLSMVRIDIPNVLDETILETDLEMVQIIKEHVLSVLRLTYDPKVSLFPHTLRNLRKEGQEPDLHVKMSEIIRTDFNPHVENIRNVFVATFLIRIQIKLLSDSQDKRLPLQYRYLSLYKLMEMEFKEKGKWTTEYEQFVSSFEDEFRNLGIRMKSAKYIHRLRDKCAHIKTGKDVLGITQLSNKDMIEIDRFFPLMTRICVNLISKKYPDKGFSLVDTTRNCVNSM